MAHGTSTTERDVLLGAPQAVQDTRLWRWAHAGSFLLGGVTFIVGSCLYYDADLDGTLSALLYTIGSFGFLAVECARGGTRCLLCVCVFLLCLLARSPQRRQTCVSCAFPRTRVLRVGACVPVCRAMVP